ncbi:acetoacetate decarboxylase family protein [Antrihabitans sp. YC2-6]|uniref:acetoacetate decarboxylase family protein n=1 Tax=Antrihabitans sp. YC2-6 TaxID=2799498 RepID=UPI0018F3A820|nr:acetoacetate decarboxylase family protein [Antrihabitans sp. YC2-6]MBJ8344749.1 acetoacetate decarboxylase family protein [Antrihabitans sp. YC2-6]
MTSHTVRGQRVDMPVQIRQASAFAATYNVSAAAAQTVIAYSGLEVLRLFPGRAVCTLVFVDYVDGDLGPYNEFGVAFLVRDPVKRPKLLGDVRAVLGGGAGVFIHRLPVDGEFTMAAGREIWGFPKELAEFETDSYAGGRRGILRKDGQLIVDLHVQQGVRLPGSGMNTSLDAFTSLAGVTRRTQWLMSPAGVRSRPGGARLSLGEHPWARELATLGLPRRAMLTSVIPELRMTFEDATPVR